MIDMPSALSEGSHTLQGIGPDERRLVILVHRPDEIATNFGGDRQRELRQALGALEEDPSQLETLLKTHREGNF